MRKKWNKINVLKLWFLPQFVYRWISKWRLLFESSWPPSEWKLNSKDQVIFNKFLPSVCALASVRQERTSAGQGLGLGLGKQHQLHCFIPSASTSLLWWTSGLVPTCQLPNRVIIFLKILSYPGICFMGGNTRFVVKPEGVNNAFLVYFWLNQWGSMEIWGESRCTIGRDETLPPPNPLPPPPRQIEHWRGGNFWLTDAYFILYLVPVKLECWVFYLQVFWSRKAHLRSSLRRDYSQVTVE